MLTNPQIMAWMDEFSKYKGDHLSGVVTGKPIIAGGPWPGRSDGSGCVIIIRETAKRRGLISRPRRRQSKGLARVVRPPVLAAEGVKIIAIMEIDGGIYNPDGLIRKRFWRTAKNGTITTFPGCQPIDNEGLWL